MLSHNLLLVLLYRVHAHPTEGMKFPDVPLDAFHPCMVKTKVIYEVSYACFSFIFG